MSIRKIEPPTHTHTHTQRVSELARTPLTFTNGSSVATSAVTTEPSALTVGYTGSLVAAGVGIADVRGGGSGGRMGGSGTCGGGS